MLGLVLGIFATVLIQSSSDSVCILLALSSTGLVTFGSAVPIILGTHIGTAFTPLLTVGGSTKDGKRAAMVHLYFNILGSVLVLLIIYLVKWTVGIPMWGDVLNKGAIANIHTLSSVFAMVLFLPFSGVLATLSRMTVRDSAEEVQELAMPVLDERLFNSPAVALQQAKNALIKMARRAGHNLNLSACLLEKYDPELVDKVNVRENLIDRMEVSITNYLISLSSLELGEAESQTVSELLNFVTEYERIGDYSVNLMESAQELNDKDVHFSPEACRELEKLSSAVEEVVGLTIKAFEDTDIRLAVMVEPLEETVDTMCELLRNRHITRLKEGVCQIDTGVVFLDVLNNMERIADHCSNVAARLIGMESGEELDAHTLKQLMHHSPSSEYQACTAEYREKYLQPLLEEKAS